MIKRLMNASPLSHISWGFLVYFIVSGVLEKNYILSVVSLAFLISDVLATLSISLMMEANAKMSIALNEYISFVKRMQDAYQAHKARYEGHNPEVAIGEHSSSDGPQPSRPH